MKVIKLEITITIELRVKELNFEISKYSLYRQIPTDRV